MPNALRVSGSQSSNVTKSCSPCRPPSHWVRSLTKTQDRERVSYRDPRFQLAPSSPPFDNILDRVTGSDPSVTDYILEAPAKCPNCRREILEKTLVEPA